MKNKMKLIQGSGGGGKNPDQATPHVPVEAPDSLQSQAFAQVIDLVSEGEINGLVNGMKSIYLDKTPIQNPDGTFNFSNLLVQSRVGTQDQTYLAGFPSVQNEVTVETEFTHVSPVIRTITNPNLDALAIKIRIPSLTYSNTSTGDLSGNHVDLTVEIQSNGGGYQIIIEDTITGKASSKYEKEYRIELTGDAPWDIRLKNVNVDATTSNDQRKTFWASYTEIEDVKLKYPNSALVGLRIDAAQFQNIPSRAYDIEGLRIKVPTNYDPPSRGYTGVWDGTFQIDYSNNPAWVFYDLLTSERYGLGQFIPDELVDKWALYQIAQYCDELVDDGFGGTEPRFTCNLYLQSRAEAYRILQDLASAFRGMIYWASGAVTVSQDAPQDAMHLFTPANTINGMFNYAGSSAKARHSVALVTWNDPNNFYAQKVEYVEDVDSIARFGVIETQVTALGCTSRGQAQRAGRWILFTEKYQTEMVTFQTGVEGAPIRPGQIIKVADPVRAGERRGGRLMSGSTTLTLYLDQPLLASATGMTMSVLLPDGTVEEKAVDTIVNTATTSTVKLQAALSLAPNISAIWIASTPSIAPQEFRVLSITEPSPGIYEITSLSHSSIKFSEIDSDLILEEASISDLSTVPASPTALQITETLYQVGPDVRVKVTCSWHQVSGAVGYNVQWQRDSQNPINMPQTSSADVEILSAEPGTYTFYVTAVNSVGAKSVPGIVSQNILGRSAAPSQVANFSLFPMAGNAYLTWDPAPDLDVLLGGSVRIRFTPNILTPAWKNAVDITPALAGSGTKATVPLMTGSYMAKFVDSSGNSSDTEAIIITTIPAALALNVVQTITESPAFAGSFSDMGYVATYGGIVLASLNLVDDIVSVDAETVWDFPGGVTPTGYYLFANAVDLGSVYTSNLTASMTVSALDIADTIDDRLNLIDDWRDIDGNFIDDVNAVLYVRTTKDNPAGSPTWTDWKPFFIGSYEFRAAQFKLVATSTNSQHNLAITALSVTIDMADRVVNATTLTSGAGSYAVTFAEPFKVAPTIGITADALNSGDYYQITGKSNTGFTITFYNSSNAAVSRTFDYLAKGYGRKTG
jgi:predicted phage tail protein